jgi:hypothetical protein
MDKGDERAPHGSIPSTWADMPVGHVGGPLAILGLKASHCKLYFWKSVLQNRSKWEETQFQSTENSLALGRVMGT